MVKQSKSECDHKCKTCPYPLSKKDSVVVRLKNEIFYNENDVKIKELELYFLVPGNEYNKLFFDEHGNERCMWCGVPVIPTISQMKKFASNSINGIKPLSKEEAEGIIKRNFQYKPRRFTPLDGEWEAYRVNTYPVFSDLRKKLFTLRGESA